MFPRAWKGLSRTTFQLNQTAFLEGNFAHVPGCVVSSPHSPLKTKHPAQKPWCTLPSSLLAPVCLLTFHPHGILDTLEVFPLARKPQQYLSCSASGIFKIENDILLIFPYRTIQSWRGGICISSSNQASQQAYDAYTIDINVMCKLIMYKQHCSLSARSSPLCRPLWMAFSLYFPNQCYFFKITIIRLRTSSCLLQHGHLLSFLILFYF